MSAVNTVIGALLPLIVTLALGFFAAWHHDFTPAQAPVLNRMVLLYALPLLLFTGTVTIKRSTLTSDLGLAAAIAGGMLGTFLVMFLIVRFALRRPVGVSALTALAVGAPAIPFAGVVVLGYLYGPSLSAVPVAVGALVFNVIEVPVTLVLLSAAAGPAAEMQARAASAPTVGPSPAAHAADRESLAQHVLSTVKEPVVWAPVLALVFVVVGVQLPFALVNAMKLLGSATTGVALFASGIVLFSQRIAVSRFVVGAVAMRNVVAPAAVWVILAAIGMSHTDLRLAVLANALPAPVAAVIFAVQYRQGQREMASVVLFSSVGSLLTLAVFIALT
jgi:malonate transporter and related proteins